MLILKANQLQSRPLRTIPYYCRATQQVLKESLRVVFGEIFLCKIVLFFMSDGIVGVLLLALANLSLPSFDVDACDVRHLMENLIMKNYV